MPFDKLIAKTLAAQTHLNFLHLDVVERKKTKNLTWKHSPVADPEFS